jgi:hypothetical protein
MAYKNNNNIDSNHNNNNQKPLSQEVGEDEVDHQYEQERYTDTYNQNYTDDRDFEKERLTDDNAYRENFTD